MSHVFAGMPRGWKAAQVGIVHEMYYLGDSCETVLTPVL